MYDKLIKRMSDVIISLIFMPLLLLIILIAAPVIYFTDRGPVFYNAPRIGKNGRIFKMYKFRSMYVNAPDIRLADGSTYNDENDPRVTKIGKFMRKTSLDEAPQLLNVLLGDMSLIGPRPDPPDWLERYPEDVKIFLKVRPGITGYNQAYFRNQADGCEKMKNDVYYALNCTLAMDIKIFFKTIGAVAFGKNTYKITENESAALEEAAKIKILEPPKEEKN